MSNLESNHYDLIKAVSDICDNFKLYGKIVDYKLDTKDERKGIYAVLSLYPIEEDVDPVKLIERNQRHDDQFYPDDFAVKLDFDNPNLVIEEMARYARNAELVDTIFKQHDVPLPSKMDGALLHSLTERNNDVINEALPEEYRNINRESLGKGMKELIPSTRIGKSWVKFRESSSYDDDASFIQNLIKYTKYDDQIVDLKDLFEEDKSIKQGYLPEYIYQRLKKYLKECNPEVKMSEGKLCKYDYGMVDVPWAKSVTEEEFWQTIDDTFETQKFDAIKNLRIGYAESRKFYYKESDEQTIISACQDIAYRYAKCNDLSELTERGTVSCIQFPADNFINFVSVAKSRNVPFYIDTMGKFDKLDWNSVGIVYCNKDKEEIDSIIDKLNNVRIFDYHEISNEQKGIRKEISADKQGNFLSDSLMERIEATKNKKGIENNASSRSEKKLIEEPTR